MGPIYDSCDNGDTVSQPAAGRTRLVAAGATGGSRFFSRARKNLANRISQPTNTLARDAIDFIARTRDFYVRELPGDLTDDEKVGVVQALVRSGVLRVAP